ncbi:MAG: DUF2306 domain-containing protein [Acidobacteria bacterium]|nr:MAG: DUF2306 domain-containing protein [Acidobacteriota bacterium]
MRSNTKLVRVLWTGVWVLAFIGIAAAAHRIFALEFPEKFSRSNSPAAVLDIGFTQHKMLTLVHVLPGVLFMVLGPLQLSRAIRNKYLNVHRWSGRVFLVCCLIVAVSALTMSFRMAIGGVNETVATVFYAILFVFCLTKAFIHIRRREIVLHREWMIRGFAIGLGVATVRPIVGAFFAARRLSPHEFFGTAFWLGFTINLIAAEAWINYTRGRPIPEQTLVLSELSTTVE